MRDAWKYILRQLVVFPQGGSSDSRRDTGFLFGDVTRPNATVGGGRHFDGVASKVNSFREYVLTQMRIHQNASSTVATSNVPVIANMDETPIWFDMPSRSTITVTGERHVKVRSSNSQRKRITAVLCCFSDGTKLPPVVIVKDAVAEIDVPEGVLVWRQENAYMTASLMRDWIDHFTATVGTHRILIMDSFSAHLSKVVKEKLKSQNISFAIVPAGCTSECQPLDVGVNKPFKDRMRMRWARFINDANIPLTQRGNFSRPSLRALLLWMKESWDEITPKMIQNAFRRAGIDGTA